MEVDSLLLEFERTGLKELFPEAVAMVNKAFPATPQHVEGGEEGL